VAETALCQTADGGWFFVYQAVWSTNGGVMVSCSISDGNETSSMSNYWDASQNGAELGTCLLPHDAEQDDTAGYWKFERLTPDGAFVVTYNDGSSAADGHVVAFDGPSAGQDGCTVFAD
jgi:hypothetical protein